MKAPETKSRAQPTTEDEKVGTRKHKTDTKGPDGDQKNKKAKSENDENGRMNGSNGNEDAEFEEFCRVTGENLTVEQMREVLEINCLDTYGSDKEVVIRCQDVMFYGPLESCVVCDGQIMYTGRNYSCRGTYSEWSTCAYNTRAPRRKRESVKLTDAVKKSSVADLIESKQDPSRRPERGVDSEDKKPFTGMTIALSGRLSRTHGYWTSEIEKNGGKVVNNAKGITCLVTTPAERERGGSLKIADAIETSVPVVSEAWLEVSIEKQVPEPLEAYDIMGHLVGDGKGIPLNKQDPTEQALETLTAEVKLYGKRCVYKDSKLDKMGGKIFEKDGIIYNCAFSLCDQGRGVNQFCVMQLVTIPESDVHLYYKKGKIGYDPRAEERDEEYGTERDAIMEFVTLFKEVTGNEFEPWEREKKFQKKPMKFYPVDMDVGVDARHGGLGFRQLGIAATHTSLDPLVANFMKVLCSREVYRYALMEMGHDAPDLPMGMLTQIHLKRCEETLLEFIEKLKSNKESGPKERALWVDFSLRWFTLMHSTRPMIFKNYQELADYAAAPLESVRDIVHASHLIGDMTGPTIDDPLSDRYNKMGCPITSVEKKSDDYKMIVQYLEKTYEPVELDDVSYDVSVEHIYAVEPSAGPSYDEVKKLPNKVLLWCGTRSSNLFRHLNKGFLPAICTLPVPGYMFGRAIVCSDAAADVARYGFTSVDRPDGFLVLAVASLGEQIIEVTSPPKDTKSLEEKKLGVVGLGKKKTDEAEHFIWKDDIKVPCGRLVPSEHEDSPLEYNEYAAYDPKQVSIRFLVGVKFEQKGHRRK